MSEDVTAQVVRLRNRVEEASRARMGAEYARQQAEKTATGIMDLLKQEFGVESLEQAQVLQTDLDNKIAAELRVIDQALGGLI